MELNVEELVIAKVKTLVPEQQKEVLKFVETLEQRTSAASGKSAAGSSKTIWDEIELLSKQVPPEEWAKVPTDLSESIDHYLYGAPKKK